MRYKPERALTHSLAKTIHKQCAAVEHPVPVPGKNCAAKKVPVPGKKV